MPEICPECGTGNPAEAKACADCGCDLTVESGRCPQCGFEQPTSNDCCSNCGVDVAAQGGWRDVFH